MVLGKALLAYHIVLGTVFTFGFVGNLLVLLVILSLKSPANAVTNIYVLNLVIADSLHLLSILPFIRLSIVKSWLWGNFLCKLFFMNHFANSNVTIYIITAMSFDRYKAVVSPFNSARYRTKKFAVILLVCLWLLSCLVVAPIYLNAYVDSLEMRRNVTDANGTIVEELRLVYRCLHPALGSVNRSEGLLKKLFTDTYYFSRYVFVTGCVLPGVLLCTFYALILRKLWQMKRSRASGAQSQQRFEKVTILVVAVVTFYLVCCLPHWVYINVVVEMSESIRAWAPIVSHITTLLGYVNSAGNPILYAFLNDSFRASLRAIVARRLPAGWRGAGTDAAGVNNNRKAGDDNAAVGLRDAANDDEPLPLLPGGAAFNTSNGLNLDKASVGVDTRITETVID